MATRKTPAKAKTEETTVPVETQEEAPAPKKPRTTSKTATKVADAPVADAAAAAPSETPGTDGTAADKPIGFWQNLRNNWITYHATHRNTVFYGFLGLLVALGIIFFGIWRALLVVALIFLGVAFGQYLDGNPRVFNSLRGLFKGKKKN